MTRVDQWLWAVRMYPTRTSATDACRGGHVRVNGTSAKPAAPVAVGTRIEVTHHDRLRILEVSALIEKRVGAAIAATCYIDHSPPVPAREFEPEVFERPRGSGRPTKRDRRVLDRLRADRS